MKEYDNYLSAFYREGSEARNLPETKRVFTETELQGALRSALVSHGVRLDKDGNLESGNRGKRK